MDNDFKSTLRKRSSLKKGIILIAVIAGIAISATVASFWVNYLEILEIGEKFVPVFMKNITVKYAFQSVSFLTVFIFCLVSLLFINKNLKKKGIQHKIFSSWIAAVVTSLLFSFFASKFIVNNLYENYMFFKNSTAFNITDPIFNKDIGYYVFQRPYIYNVLESIVAVWTVLTIFVVIVYFLFYVKLGERNVIDMIDDNGIVFHIAVNVIVFMVFKAATMFLACQGVLYSDFAGLKGSGFIETNIWVNYYHYMPIVMLLITVLIIIFLKNKNIKKAIFAFLSYFAIAILVNIVAFAVDTFYVSPNEVAVENVYIQRNIEFTRKAYNIDNVREVEYPYQNDASKVDLTNEYDTINNIRIIDFPATITATNQLQGIRNYYQFKDLDVGLYNIDNKKQAIGIGVREIEKENIEDSAKNYINEKFRYTHGYGVVMASFNTVNAQGEPYYFIKDINPKKQEGIPFVKQPRVYFGELNDDGVIVNTKTRELDYPEGTTDHVFDYDGSAGISLNLWNRILFAFRTGDFRMVIANQITDQSRLLINRNVYTRVRKVAPFLNFDDNATVVIDDDGTLKWVVDGYTTTDKYPYSQSTKDYNYIRNSVKAVVDAYNGTVKFYIIDKSDPIIQTFDKIYPTLFEKDGIPDSIMSKCTYPESLFMTQCNIYTQYHNTSPTTFYNQNDKYAIANEKYSDDIRQIEPYYNIMQLDEFNKENSELVLMLPFTLYNRENMTSWIAAGNEKDNYGKLVAYKFPKDKNVYGPLQVENLIDNNPDISREMTLWGSGGSNVIRGNLLVIPVADTILYIEPVYLSTANQASFPTLKRVIAVYGDNIAMEETLQESLKKVFGEKNYQGKEPEVPVIEESNDDYIKRIVDAYSRIEQNANSGNWREFGNSMADMKEIIGEMQKNKE